MTTSHVAASLSMIEKQATPDRDHQLAAHLRRFGPIGILAILVILAGNFIIAPLSALLVLLWARLSNTPWRELGFARPASWTRTLLFGASFGIALKFLLKAVVMPLLGAPPVNQAYHYLVGNTAALPGIVLTMLIVAGFGEETLFRGYLFERFDKLWGTKAAGRMTTVLLTSAWFALLHYREQGLPGVEQAAITGLMFGTMYAATRRLWIPMVAHAAFDLTAVAMIYYNVESDIAHLFLK